MARPGPTASPPRSRGSEVRPGARAADRLGRGLAAASGALLALILLALVTLDALQVALRYLLGTGWPWAGDLAVILLLSLAWIGAGHLWLGGGHVAVDLLPDRPRLRAALDAAFGLCVVLGGLLLLPLALDTLAVYGTIALPALPVPASAKYVPVVLGTLYVVVAAVIRLAAPRGGPR